MLELCTRHGEKNPLCGFCVFTCVNTPEWLETKNSSGRLNAFRSLEMYRFRSFESESQLVHAIGVLLEHKFSSQHEVELSEP